MGFSLTRSKAYQRSFPGLVNFPWFQQWSALVSKSACACQHYFYSFPATADATRDTEVVRPTAAALDAAGAAAPDNVCQLGQGPIAPNHLSPIAKILASASVSMVAAEAWDAASDLA